MRVVPQETTTVSIRKLKQHPKNPRRGNVKAIRASIDAHGFYGSIVAQRSTGHILAGNHRWIAAKEAGAKTIPVTFVDVTDDEALRILLSDNRTNDLGVYDTDDLHSVLADLQTATGTLEGTGYDAAFLDSLTQPEARYSRERVPLADLKPHPRNYKEHPEDQVTHLAASLEEHGAYRAIITANDLTILAGHGLALAFKRLAREHVDILRLPIDANDTRALRLMAADNELPAFAERDDRALTELLKEILADGGLMGTGFTEQMLANLLFVTRPKSEIADFDEAQEWVGMPEYDESAPVFKLILQFRSQEERAAFMKANSVQINGDPAPERPTLSTWHPPKARNDRQLLRFES